MWPRLSSLGNPQPVPQALGGPSPSGSPALLAGGRGPVTALSRSARRPRLVATRGRLLVGLLRFQRPPELVNERVDLPLGFHAGLAEGELRLGVGQVLV